MIPYQMRLALKMCVLYPPLREGLLRALGPLLRLCPRRRHAVPRHERPGAFRSVLSRGAGIATHDACGLRGITERDGARWGRGEPPSRPRARQPLALYAEPEEGAEAVEALAPGLVRGVRRKKVAHA
jgi:hypothetical protein